MTRVSVCLPTYNGERFIREAVKSILSQKSSNFELIVSDDASTDNTFQIVSGIDDSRLHLSTNSQRMGLVGNWNRCLTLSRCEYITIFHQDDVMQPNNLAAKAALLDSHPEMGLVHSNIETIDAKGVVTGGHWATQPSEAPITPGKQIFEQLALRGNFIACPSVMVRAECFETLGDFDAQLPFTCDLEMWMRVARHYDIGYLTSPLIANRVHTNQETKRYTGGGQEIREVRRALKIAFTDHPPSGVSPNLRRSAFHNLAIIAYHMGRWKLGNRHWRSALGYFSASGEALLSALN